MENGRNCLRNTPEQIPQKELGPPEHRGRPPPLNALTEPQRQFAEEHHALIYQFLLDRRLDICEYYDTRDPEPALDALGLTEQEIAGDKRLCAAYLTARRQEAA